MSIFFLTVYLAPMHHASRWKRETHSLDIIKNVTDGTTTLYLLAFVYLELFPAAISRAFFLPLTQLSLVSLFLLQALHTSYADVFAKSELF